MQLDPRLTNPSEQNNFFVTWELFLKLESKQSHVVDIYELVCAEDCTCGDSPLNYVDLGFGILTESITLFLELNCNLIVKKLDNLNILARLHLGAEKKLKWSHVDASLKSRVNDFL
ncbi:hypothetical protein TNCV_4803451 [Trichonephila clavipes]|nr:hypothetical protein TNCV_4803451 [Trichonephila clavipes]